ncbi:hypothetical protein HK102_000403 [Quaeritorhiza haematococci]|nr:hypothetical protein HK102_000403 [Quaeritorhiza haematococci]
MDVPWSPLLQQTYKKNFDVNKFETIYLQLASVKSNGTPKLQTIVFQDFLPADPKVLLFVGAARNADLMSVVKSSQTHEVFWQMPKTKDTWTFTGRMYIVAAPTLSHRFGTPPRRVNTNDDRTADEFWERERLRQWKRLSAQMRATFTWPGSGEVKTPATGSSWSVYQTSIRLPPPTIDSGFKYMKLDSMIGDIDEHLGASTTLSNTLSRGGKSEKDEELRCVHNAALDNYTLLVFKVSRVDHWEPGAITPPTRMIFNCAKDGSWTVEEVNP